MPVWLQYVLVCTVPTALIWSLVAIPRGLHWWALRQPDRPASRVPIERLVADLRRLSADQDAVRTGWELPARHRRLTAIELAYDDVLLECCDALEIAHSGSPPLSREQRHAVEAALLRSGLRW